MSVRPALLQKSRGYGFLTGSAAGAGGAIIAESFFIVSGAIAGAAIAGAGAAAAAAAAAESAAGGLVSDEQAAAARTTANKAMRFIENSKAVACVLRALKTHGPPVESGGAQVVRSYYTVRMCQDTAKVA